MNITNLLLPLKVISANKYRGVYIEDNYENTVCDFYYMHDGKVIDFGFNPEAAANDLVNAANYAHKLEQQKLNSDLAMLEKHNLALEVVS